MMAVLEVPYGVAYRLCTQAQAQHAAPSVGPYVGGGAPAERRPWDGWEEELEDGEGLSEGAIPPWDKVVAYLRYGVQYLKARDKPYGEKLRELIAKPNMGDADREFATLMLTLDPWSDGQFGLALYRGMGDKVRLLLEETAPDRMRGAWRWRGRFASPSPSTAKVPSLGIGRL